MITILKLGGELLEDAAAMRAAARGIAALRAGGPLAVVHGGGRAIDADLKARGKTPRFVDGLRVTDEDTLDTVVGPISWGGKNLPPFAQKNIANTALVGGQWRVRNGTKYDIIITDNKTVPAIPVGGRMEPIG